MNRIRQAACIVLTFLFLGGCAASDKNGSDFGVESFSEEQTLIGTAEYVTGSQTEKETLPKEESTDVTSAETVRTTKAKKTTTAKATVAGSSATTKAATTAVKSTSAAETKAETTSEASTTVTAKASTTAEITTTTQRSATTTTAKSPSTTVTTARRTTTTATTRKITTTERKTTTTTRTTTQTSTQRRDASVVLNGTDIRFGSAKQEIINLIGQPTETVTERHSSGGTTENLVYAGDYSKLAVFQVYNGKLQGFYTCNPDTYVTDGEKRYSVRSGGNSTVGNVNIKDYTDDLDGGKVYAFRAYVSGYGCGFSGMETCEGGERITLHVTNAVRALHGQPPLSYCEKAARSARLHSEDMAARGYFNHNTPEGVTSSQRMKNQGIRYSTCGENIAAGYLNAFELVDGWYNSSGHRSNMLSGGFDYLGVGIAKSDDGYGAYACQNFYA